MMLLGRLTIVLAAVGLLGSPVAILYCPGDDPAAMACCQHGANDCNQRGKSDDCCRTVPTDGQTDAVAAKAGGLAKPQLLLASTGYLPTVALGALRPRVSFGIRPQHVLQDLSPPPLSILRI